MSKNNLSLIIKSLKISALRPVRASSDFCSTRSLQSHRLHRTNDDGTKGSVGLRLFRDLFLMVPGNVWWESTLAILAIQKLNSSLLIIKN